LASYNKFVNKNKHESFFLFFSFDFFCYFLFLRNNLIVSDDLLYGKKNAKNSASGLIVPGDLSDGKRNENNSASGLIVPSDLLNGKMQKISQVV
jgi:hypothetical protein